MNKILVIGASGFLGRQLLAVQPEGVIGTFFEHAHAGHISLDLRDRSAIDRVMQQVRPDVVLYAAGLTDVAQCEHRKKEAHALNCAAPGHLASFGNVRVCYFSTDYVFDGAQGRYLEEDEPRPLNYYGASKLAGEREVLRRNPRNVVIRVSGLYDSEGVKGRRFTSPAGAADSLDADDTRLSSPVHAADVVSATRAILQSGMGGTFHVAGPDVLSRYEFAQIAALHVPGSPRVTPSKRFAAAHRAARPPNSSLLTTRMKALGWQPRRVADALHQHFWNDSGLRRQQRRASRLGLLIDCVGALLTRRNWLPADPELAQIDTDCAGVLDGGSFWTHAAARLGRTSDQIRLVQDDLAARYVPNPDVWNLLPEWRSLFQLALVNNGASATFRRWAEKYGLAHVFDFLANSEELGVRKPEGAFFLRVAKELRLPAERCLLIDDSRENVEAANRYGLSVLLTKELGQFPLALHKCDRAEVIRKTSFMLVK